MIEFYDFGKVIIDGKEYTSDVIIYPERVEANWWRRKGHELCLDDIQEVLKKKPDILVVGIGYSGLMRILPEVKQALEKEGVKLIVKSTSEACQIFNQLLRSNQSAVAALHLTC